MRQAVFGAAPVDVKQRVAFVAQQAGVEKGFQAVERQVEQYLQAPVTSPEFAPEQRQELFERTRQGKVRILIGSTSKLGTGVNVQNKVISIDHLDCPWKPSDITQRNGRGVRQGNENPEIMIKQFVAKRISRNLRHVLPFSALGGMRHHSRRSADEQGSRLSALLRLGTEASGTRPLASQVTKGGLNGLMHRTPVDLKSSVLRVTTVRS